MWFIHFLVVLLTLIRGKVICDEIGYFWHITDFHYDPYFSNYEDSKKGCWRSEIEGGIRTYKKPIERFGDYNCDSPWKLIESAAKLMASKQTENLEFVLWTGDTLSRSVKQKGPLSLEYVQNLTDLLRKTFKSQFVFPALGHQDPESKRHLGNMWSRWLPTDSLKTFESGGYYMIERTLQLQIIMLNTNLMTKGKYDEDAKRQWEWLNTVLEKCESRQETVYLVGHIPPGSDERRGASEMVYSEYYNQKYIQIVRKYARIIMGQFFGHLHSDTFRVIYDEKGSAVSWILLSPSLTPKRMSNGQNNPSLRIYKFHKKSGQVLDYTQHYLDLSKANRGKADWQEEYTFRNYYGVSNITPATLHSLGEKLTSNLNFEEDTFTKYFKANSVRIYNSTQSTCDFSCAHSHYCAITRVDFKEFEDCLKTVPSAFSSPSATLPKDASLLFLTIVVELCVL